MNVWFRYREKEKLVNLQMVTHPDPVPRIKSPQYLLLSGMRKGSHQPEGITAHVKTLLERGMEIVSNHIELGHDADEFLPL